MSEPTGNGDGDNFDPDVHDPETGVASGSAAADGTGSHSSPDAETRASEVDDITAEINRILDGEPAAVAEDDGAAVAGDVDVAALIAERDEFKSIAQRVQADFDNFRKQSALRATADAERATGKLAEALLPVLDAAEAAAVRHPDEVGPLLKQMVVELAKNGLEVLDIAGQPFDPEVAEAVAHEPGEGGDPVVAEVLRSGYAWKGRTLRAAMVKTKD